MYVRIEVDEELVDVDELLVQSSIAPFMWSSLSSVRLRLHVVPPFLLVAFRGYEVNVPCFVT